MIIINFQLSKVYCRQSQKLVPMVPITVWLIFSLVMIQICDVGETSTLREKGAKEVFEILVHSRFNIDKFPVDDQDVPNPRQQYK